MEPKSAKNRQKIDAKNDRKIDAFQDRFLNRIWWILGAKMEASWYQDESKMAPRRTKKTRISRSLVEKCEKAFGTTIVMYFWFSGVGKTSIFLNLESKWDHVGNQNRSKIDPKTRSACEGILEPIFLPFWWGSGAKLGGKIEPRSKKKCIENMMQNQSRSEGVLERFGVDFGLQNGTQKRPNTRGSFHF